MKMILVSSMLAMLPLSGAEKAVGKQTRSVQSPATVGGQVRRPGYVETKPGLTLFSAIQAAGGPTEFGATRRVKLIRDGKATFYDLRDDPQKQVLIRPGDMIEVPEKNFFGR